MNELDVFIVYAVSGACQSDCILNENGIFNDIS